MRISILFCCFNLLFSGFSAQSSDLDSLYLSKVKSIDATIQTLYGVISGAAGEKRNWELFHYLFAENARLIPTGKNKEGKVIARFSSPVEYQQNSGKWLEEKGFYENELFRQTEIFGNITQVFSTYEAFKTTADEQPFMRGINSIQLLFDGNRWWVVNIFWSNETPENPIPEKYLPH